jgi:hypothetical protein
MNNFATYRQKSRHLQKIVAYASNSAFSHMDTFVTVVHAGIARRCKTCGHCRQPASLRDSGSGVARQLLP